MADPMIIAEMSRLPMARQHLESSAVIRAFWPQLSKAARERGCYYNVAAFDTNDTPHAGYAIIWDDRYKYDLYGGEDLRFRDSGGGTLARHSMLKQAATVVPSFDFEGSMIETSGRFFHQFGGD